MKAITKSKVGSLNFRHAFGSQNPSMRLEGMSEI